MTSALLAAFTFKYQICYDFKYARFDSLHCINRTKDSMRCYINSVGARFQSFLKLNFLGANIEQKVQFFQRCCLFVKTEFVALTKIACNLLFYGSPLIALSLIG